MARKFSSLKKPEEIEEDFQRRVEPGTHYCKRVGNIMCSSLYLALTGLIDHGDFERPRRVGLYSYGSGCCSEFFSGIVTRRAQEKLSGQQIKKQLDKRYPLSFSEYESLFVHDQTFEFGKNDFTTQKDAVSGVWKAVQGSGLLFLDRIEKNFQRKYIRS